MSKKRKNIWTEDKKEEWSIRQKKVWTSSEMRQVASECSNRYWSDETNRQLRSESKKEYWSNNSNRERLSKKIQGMKWWNNGQICKRSKECPGSDFVPGRLTKTA